MGKTIMQDDGNIQIPAAWKKIPERLLQSEHAQQGVMVLGGVDSGKTTLVNYITSVCQVSIAGACVDADVGQSVIGPPSTVGLRYLAAVPEGCPDTLLRFVGSVTPPGTLVQLYTAVLRLVQRARSDQQHAGTGGVIIDTPGFVYGDMARAFMCNLIEGLKPLSLVVLTKREDELGEITRTFRNDPSVEIFPVETSAETTKKKSAKERAEYRRRCFEQYFAQARCVELNVEQRGMSGFVPRGEATSAKGRVIGLLDKHHDMLALGVVQHYDARRNVLRCLSSDLLTGRVTNIQFGKMNLNEFV